MRISHGPSRRRTTLLAAVLLATTLFVTPFMTASTMVTAERILQANWRGAYDLLVTADDGLGSSAAQTAGLLEQNFVSLTGAGDVSQEQLERLGDLEGVEVAAPLSFVGALDSPAYGVLVGATDPDGASGGGFYSGEPKAFDVGVEIVAGDGVQERVLSRTATTVVTARGDVGPLIATNDDILVSNWTSGDGRWSADVTLPGLPTLASGIVAVDPVAEQQLLGPESHVLDGLVEFEKRRAAGSSPRALAELVDEQYEFEYWSLANQEGPVNALPLVINDAAYSDVSARVSFSPLELDQADRTGLMTVTQPGVAALTSEGLLALAAAERGPAETSTISLTERLVPFAQPALVVGLPGAVEPPGGAALDSTPSLVPQLAPRARYTDAHGRSDVPTGVATGVEVIPQGFATVTSLAREQTYRPAPRGSTAPLPSVLYAPVGTYTPSDVAGQARSASYVPLGTYSAGEARVADGEHAGAILQPSFSGRGLVLSAPGAITTLSGMSALQGHVGIDVVRVRVAGVSTYSPESMQVVERVATAIAELGLSVRVVSGSSLGPVGVYVPAFFEDGSDLGWTIQEWTSLGAAVRVESATSAGAYALQAVGLVGVGALALFAQWLQLANRRAEATFLGTLGWSRSRVIRWFLAENAMGAAAVVAATVAAFFVSPRGEFWGAVVAVAVGYVGLTGVGAWWATRPAHGARWATRAWPAARTARAVGVRSASAHPAVGGMVAVGLVVLGVTATAATSTILLAREAAGTTRLATLMSDHLLWPQVALVVCSLTAGVALFVVGARSLADGMRPGLRVLHWAGWDHQYVAKVARAALLAVSLPGAGIAAAASAALTWALAPDDFILGVLPGAGVVAAAVVLALVHRSLEDRRGVRAGSLAASGSRSELGRTP